MNNLSRRASIINQEWQTLPKAPNPCISRITYETGLRHSTKNRYQDVLPFEATRVKLSNPHDYINANYVKVCEKGQFISTQAPLPQTFDTFWKMVWENNVPVIVMLTKIMEKRKIKAHCYWPALGDTEEFEDIFVTLKSESQDGYITVRFLELKYNNEIRTLHHIQYTEWPDFGVPRSTATIRKVVEFCDKYRLAKSGNGTAVVHCSAGVGRCGTFLAIQCVVEKLKSNIPPSAIDVKNIVSSLREYRMAMVQTKDQYKFIYQVMEEVSYFNISPDISPPTPQLTSHFSSSEINVASDRSSLVRSYSNLSSPSYPVFS